KRTDGGVLLDVAIRAFRSLRRRGRGDLGIDSRDEAVGDEAARFHPIDFVEERVLVLIYLRDIGVGRKRLDSMFDFFDRTPIEAVNLFDLGANASVAVNHFARTQTANSQWAERQPVVVLKAILSDGGHQDRVAGRIICSFAQSERTVSMQEIAQAPRHGEARIYIQAHSALPAIAPEVGALDVVVGIGE